MSVIESVGRLATGTSTTTRRRSHVGQLEVDPYAHVHSLYERYGKPILDRVGAFVLLVLAVPLMLACVLLVLVSLGRPVLLRQQRVGHRGRTFTVVKFRTMHADRRSREAPYDGPDRRVTHKHPQDPRLTGIGRGLRKLSLDELPQLVNVLRGEMSLVGPRPELPAVVARHYAPQHHRRHAVRPGLTGLWQVSERNAGLMYEHVDTDLRYVDSVGLWTDLKILVRTPLAAFGTHGKGF